ncbi:ABC transporter ATP-binding protein ['Camptotheca acuminata' phytoplasma]|uniref:ABC transporter ATP-binding protein n=1 Tax='Camptotheca acuminata' phytoplasma TaxID=3239192 RepID=UPI00351A21B9
MDTKVLEIINLKIHFKIKNNLIYALRGLDLSLYQNEILGLVGESGSGKSVISKALTGLLPSNAVLENGSIFYNKQDSNLPEKQEKIDLTKSKDKNFNKIRGNEISIIFQNPISSLNPLLKIGHQIKESLKLRNKKLKTKELKDKVFKLMKEVGINNPEKRYYQFPHQLSGGLCQRIVIAIALANQSKVLICDEPTTALDVSVQKKILDLIKKIQKKTNMAVIFISHDLDVVKYISDRIAVIYAVKIVEHGTNKEIFYNSQHPYTWALLQSMPRFSKKGEKLTTIEGTPIILNKPIEADAYAFRNPYALKIDFEKQPPMFSVSSTHYAATWLLHEFAPKIEIPPLILKLKRKGGFV